MIQHAEKRVFSHSRLPHGSPTPQHASMHTNSIKTNKIFRTHFPFHNFLFIHIIPYLETIRSQISRFDCNPKCEDKNK